MLPPFSGDTPLTISLALWLYEDERQKRNILNVFKAEDMKKSVLIPAAFLVGTLGWCQPALPTYQRYLQEK